MHLQESGEMYLETVYILSEKNGAVRSIDVGEYMGFSKLSVSRAVGLLKKAVILSCTNRGGIFLLPIPVWKQPKKYMSATQPCQKF